MAAKKKSSAKKTAKVTKSTSSTKTKSLSISQPLTKSGIGKYIANMTGCTNKAASDFLSAFTSVIEAHIRPKGPGKFTFPGLLKITVVKKAARPARKGINPFTGEEVMFKAKPAHKVVKIKPLKALKEKVD
jgi:nucleoid DNA-binding protein